MSTKHGRFRSFNFATLFIFATLTSLLLAGCASTGGSQPAAEVEPAEKELVEVYPNKDMNYIFEEDPNIERDLSTEKDVIAALRSNPALDTSNIGVTCTNGIVTLRGGVGSELERLLAARIAGTVTGVTEVRNLIQSQG